MKQIVPPVINSFSDQDSRVRYYACEALYNIAKVKNIVVFMPFGLFLLCVIGIDASLPFLLWLTTGCERRVHYFLQSDFRCSMQALSRF